MAQGFLCAKVEYLSELLVDLDKNFRDKIWVGGCFRYKRNSLFFGMYMILILDREFSIIQFDIIF